VFAKTWHFPLKWSEQIFLNLFIRQVSRIQNWKSTSSLRAEGYFARLLLVSQRELNLLITLAGLMIDGEASLSKIFRAHSSLDLGLLGKYQPARTACPSPSVLDYWFLHRQAFLEVELRCAPGHEACTSCYAPSWFRDWVFFDFYSNLLATSRFSLLTLEPTAAFCVRAVHDGCRWISWLMLGCCAIYLSEASSCHIGGNLFCSMVDWSFRYYIVRKKTLL